MFLMLHFSLRTTSLSNQFLPVKVESRATYDLLHQVNVTNSPTTRGENGTGRTGRDGGKSRNLR